MTGPYLQSCSTGGTVRRNGGMHPLHGGLHRIPCPIAGRFTYTAHSDS